MSLFALELFHFLAELLDFLLQTVDGRLLAAVLGHQVPVLLVDAFSFSHLALDQSDLVLQMTSFLMALLKEVGLALVLRSELVDLLHSLLAQVGLLLELPFLLLQLHQLHLEVARLLALFLELHLLELEGFLQILQLLEVLLLVENVATLGHLLLLDEHVLLDVGLLQLLSQSEALVDVHSELHLDLVGF